MRGRSWGKVPCPGAWPGPRGSGAGDRADAACMSTTSRSGWHRIMHSTIRHKRLNADTGQPMRKGCTVTAKESKGARGMQTAAAMQRHRHEGRDGLAGTTRGKRSGSKDEGVKASSQGTHLCLHRMHEASCKGPLLSCAAQLQSLVMTHRHTRCPLKATRRCIFKSP